MTNGSYWVLDGTRTITWALTDVTPLYFWPNPAAAQSLIASALSSFEQVANVRFQYVGHYADPTFAPADITFTLAGFPFPELFGFSSFTTGGWAYFPYEPMSDSIIRGLFGTSDVYPNASGDVWINAALSSSLFPGGGGYAVLLHEIGHALGLKHPHDNGGTGRPTFTQIGIDPFDLNVVTVMSYDDSLSPSWWFGQPATLMPLDIAALWQLYGPNPNTNAGDSVHHLIWNAQWQTIYDASGNDWADASGSTFGWVISLSEAGVALADDSIGATLYWLLGIENALGSPQADTISADILPATILGLAGNDSITGGLGADTLHGNQGSDTVRGGPGFDGITGGEGNDALFGDEGNDTLTGGAGNDILEGSSGVDRAVFVGNRVAFTITKVSTGYTAKDNVGTDGVDILLNIERLQFSDKKVALDLGPGEAAGNTVRIIGAAFDAPIIQQRPDYVGIGLSLFDSDMSMLAVGQLVIRAMGYPDNEAFVNTVYKNVVGVLPSIGDRNFYVGLLQGSGGTMTQAELLMLAANADANAVNINLVGLQQSGVDFV